MSVLFCLLAVATDEVRGQGWVDPRGEELAVHRDALKPYGTEWQITAGGKTVEGTVPALAPPFEVVIAGGGKRFTIALAAGETRRIHSFSGRVSDGTAVLATAFDSGSGDWSAKAEDPLFPVWGRDKDLTLDGSDLSKLPVLLRGKSCLVVLALAASLTAWREKLETAYDAVFRNDWTTFKSCFRAGKSEATIKDTWAAILGNSKNNKTAKYRVTELNPRGCTLSTKSVRLDRLDESGNRVGSTLSSLVLEDGRWAVKTLSP